MSGFCNEARNDKRQFFDYVGQPVGSNEDELQAVVIDSTVVYSDPQLRRAYFRLMRKHAAAGGFRIVVPEVVIQECVNAFRERSEKAYAEMRKQADEIDRLGLPSVVPDARTREARVQDYEAQLRRACAEPGWEIAPIPEVPHSDLVPMAIAKTKPFGRRGTGYRDALIWETVLTEARGGRVAFITNNTRDFCNDDASGLADDLVRGILLLRLSRDRVTWHSDLKSFVEAVIPAIDRVVEEVRDHIANDQVFRETMSSLISAASSGLRLDESWREIGGTLRPFGMPSEATEPTMDWFDTERIEIEDAYEGDDGEVVLDIIARGDAQIDFFIPKWSAFGDEDYVIVDGDWNEWVAFATVTRTMDLNLTISYDPEAGELSDADITSWGGVPDD